MGGKFWMVYVESGNNPTYRHETLELAKAEAKRLTIDYPVKKAYVLEVLGYMQKVEVEWHYANDELPFE